MGLKKVKISAIMRIDGYTWWCPKCERNVELGLEELDFEGLFYDDCDGQVVQCPECDTEYEIEFDEESLQ